MEWGGTYFIHQTPNLKFIIGSSYHVWSTNENPLLQRVVMERIDEKLLRCCSIMCERVVNMKPVPVPQVLFSLFCFLALLQFGENYNLKLHNFIIQCNFYTRCKITPYNSYDHEKANLHDVILFKSTTPSGSELNENIFKWWSTN